MNIRLHPDSVPWKSINETFDINIPDFCIITGLNGTGKSHLLEGILEGKVQLFEDDMFISYRDVCRLFSGFSFATNDSNPILTSSIDQQIIRFYSYFIHLLYKQTEQKDSTIALNQIGSHEITFKQKVVIQKIAHFTNKEVDKLTEEDFLMHFPVSVIDVDKNIFQQNLSEIFKDYATKKYNNELSGFRNYQFPDQNNIFLNISEFEELHGKPPWDLLNKLIESAYLDYKVTFPSNNFQPQASFEAKLINTVSGAEIKFQDLSSGEKVIISLVISLYNTNLDYTFPKVLLLDEPDAPLHPSMCKQLLNTIYKTFVIENRVKVIMTTHSPTTVALANEEWLYVMNKTSPRIEKTTKDKALKILTTGVPSISINYENRRQVFVEDQNDAEYYDKLYNKLSDKLIPEISLTFISAGESRVDKNGQPITGCDQVKNVTNLLDRSGNQFIRGLIDWDYKNTQTNAIKVLGEQKRHSIENYLLDPLLVSALLIRERLDSVKVNLGLNFNLISDFKLQDPSLLQSIADYTINKVKEKINDKEIVNFYERNKGNLMLTDEELMNGVTSCEYLNGCKLEIPNWYLLMQGHLLEKALKESIPTLRRYINEKALKLEIIELVIGDIPEFAPKDLLTVLTELQE